MDAALPSFTNLVRKKIKQSFWRRRFLKIFVENGNFFKLVHLTDITFLSHIESRKIRCHNFPTSLYITRYYRIWSGIVSSFILVILGIMADQCGIIIHVLHHSYGISTYVSIFYTYLGYWATCMAEWVSMYRACIPGSSDHSRISRSFFRELCALSVVFLRNWGLLSRDLWLY